MTKPENSTPNTRLELDVELIADLDADDATLSTLGGGGKSAQLTSAQPTNTCTSLSTGI